MFVGSNIPSKLQEYSWISCQNAKNDSSTVVDWKVSQELLHTQDSTFEI